ncbi:hypothetical protein H2198_002447 [Neophaeococcomyces mojaviensis]|uniref:Uncharacterized protein n=1 Tax=Neophaeococcomyces mojaviensis TaxID=3383035 RepID=A0ACC3ADW7_9EURO|nr:hypothetical protein H2198_002447 [Knufia sp. JES_112]
MDNLDETFSRLITAFHILHTNEILDEQGHVSVRNPHDSSTFFTSDVPPILVSSMNDLTQWNVADGSPVTSPYDGCQTVQQVSPHSEHFIHSCIYNRYPGVQSIVHSHCLTAIVYGLCNSRGSMLQPSYQMAGFLGHQSPIFDTAKHYATLPSSHPRNLLVNHKYLGDALAKTFSRPQDMDGAVDLPDHGVVFQRGHGFVTWAGGIEDAVYRAIHICRDAEIQTTAMTQRGDGDLEVVYLDEREAKDCEETINRATPQMWSAWVAQVERSGLYHNDLSRS